MMKKVALINPGKNREYADNEPLNLGYLASYLRLHSVDIKIIDELAGDNVELELKKYNPDFVGVTATTPMVCDAYDILTYARKQGYITVIGGVHASVMPEEASEYADFVVAGEGELALLDVVSSRATGKIIRGDFIKNLDDIPFPARDLMNVDFYVNNRRRVPTAHLYFVKKGMRLTSMITSRGCPYDCVFCHNSWKELPLRYNSPERVIEEIIHLKEKYEIDAIFFMDDDFFVNKQRLAAICERIKQKNVKFDWAANARVTSVSPETLRIAGEAGLKQISFGIESGSQKILDILNKKTSVEQGKTAVRIAREAGVSVYATFMIGNPSETMEDLELTRRFILENDMDSFGIGITTPYPGTQLWNRCRQKNLIPEKYDWKDFNMEICPVSSNENFTRNEIEKMRSRLLLEILFKSNFKFVLFYLKSILSHPAEVIIKIFRLLAPLIANIRRK